MPRALIQRTAHARADLAAVAPRLQARLLTERFARAQEKLASLWRLAELAHPERPLQRGFVRVTDRAGRTLIHAADARAAGAIDLRFADGRVAAHIGDGAGPMPFARQSGLSARARHPICRVSRDLFDAED